MISTDASSVTVELRANSSFLSPVHSVQTPQPRQEIDHLGSGLNHYDSDLTFAFENDMNIFDPGLLADISGKGLNNYLYTDIGQL